MSENNSNSSGVIPAFDVSTTFDTSKQNDIWNGLKQKPIFISPNMFKDEVKGKQINKVIENQERSMKVLESIEENTANLYTLVELINISNSKQDDILELINEMHEIAISKNLSEADTRYKKVMKKITEQVKDVDTIVKLTAYTTSIYNALKPILVEHGGAVLESIKNLHP